MPLVGTDTGASSAWKAGVCFWEGVVDVWVDGVVVGSTLVDDHVGVSDVGAADGDVFVSKVVVELFDNQVSSRLEHKKDQVRATDHSPRLDVRHSNRPSHASSDGSSHDHKDQDGA